MFVNKRLLCLVSCVLLLYLTNLKSVIYVVICYLVDHVQPIILHVPLPVLTFMLFFTNTVVGIRFSLDLFDM